MSTRAALPGDSFFRRRDLLAQGWTDRALAAAVADGRLLKPRANTYLPVSTPDAVLTACALGGRLTCTSALRRWGVFVLQEADLHVHVTKSRRGAPSPSRRVRRHWDRLRRAPEPRSTSVSPFDAVLHAVGCQTPRAALATLDSALRLGYLHVDDLDDLFGSLPRRHAVLRRLIDQRAESGPETLVRLILRSLRVSFQVQVPVDGVGRVDFVVDGWLIVECDSEGFHSTWEQQRRDRRRDQAAAARGFATYRPIAEDIMWHPDEVRAALVGLLALRPRTVKARGSMADHGAGGASRDRFSLPV